MNVFNTNRSNALGQIYADLELANAVDVDSARRGKIRQDEVRKVTVRALTDSGVYLMVIPEHVTVQLDLLEVEKRECTMADGSTNVLPIVGSMWLRFKNRQTVCFAISAPTRETLLGSIPMEDLDVILNPRSQTMEVNPENPYMPHIRL
jgi:clan AA aspartic protease